MNKAPSFEHRHFKVIASIIADMSREGFKATTADVADHFARRLSVTNPRFDHDRFIAACSGKPSNGRDKVRS